MEFTVIFVLAGIIVLGAVLFLLLSYGKKGPKLNIQKNRIQFLSIEQQLRADQPASYHMAILNADKMLDKIMQDLNVKGNTMGERLKAYNNKFSDVNSVWAAHKLRNQIAHEPNVSITYRDAVIAVKQFRKALKDLGAI